MNNPGEAAVFYKEIP